MPLKNIATFYALTLAFAAVLTGGIAWYGGKTSLVELANLATMVAVGVALLALPLLKGSSSHDGGPDLSASAPALDNRARGVVALAAAASWLGLAIAVEVLTR